VTVKCRTAIIGVVPLLEFMSKSNADLLAHSMLCVCFACLCLVCPMLPVAVDCPS
jgi:hypothetical protein